MTAVLIVALAVAVVVAVVLAVGESSTSRQGSAPAALFQQLANASSRPPPRVW